MTTQRGATLIELIVICILIIAIAAPFIIQINPVTAIQKAHDSKRISDLITLSQIMEQYVADHQNLPPDANMLLRQSDTATPSADIAKSTGTGWIPVDLSKYIEKLPIDPINTAPYVYRYYRSGYAYKIDAKLEYYTDRMANTADGGNDACHYEVGSGLTAITLPNGC